MGQIKADYQEMASIANSVLKSSDEYTSCLNNMYKVIDSLGNDWKGSDNLSYVNTANSYKDDMNKLGVVISDYAKFLADSADIIRRTQEEIASQAGHAGN